MQKRYAFCFFVYLLIPYELLKKHLNTLLLFKYYTIKLCLGCGDQNIRQGSREQKNVQFFFLNIGSIGTTLVWKSLPSSQTSKKCFLLFLLQSKFLVVRVSKNLFVISGSFFKRQLLFTKIPKNVNN